MKHRSRQSIELGDKRLAQLLRALRVIGTCSTEEYRRMWPRWDVALGICSSSLDLNVALTGSTNNVLL
jgi:hypothetical protein